MITSDAPFDLYMGMLPEFPELGGRRALKLTSEQMVQCLIDAYSGRSPNQALRAIGLSGDTLARYRKRAQDPEDPYYEVLQAFFALVSEAYRDGVGARQAALETQNEEGDDAEDFDPFYAAEPGHHILLITEKETYEVDGQLMERTRKVVPNAPPQTQAIYEKESDRLLRLIREDGHRPRLCSCANCGALVATYYELEKQGQGRLMDYEGP